MNNYNLLATNDVRMIENRCPSRKAFLSEEEMI